MLLLREGTNKTDSYRSILKGGKAVSMIRVFRKNFPGFSRGKWAVWLDIDDEGASIEIAEGKTKRSALLNAIIRMDTARFHLGQLFSASKPPKPRTAKNGKS
jgi:hypothetical protein